MPDSVVITRPLAQAGPLAERVRALGLPVTLLPLLDIAPLADCSALRAALARLADYAMVVFVSPNAIDAAFAHLPQPVAWPAGVTLAVLGDGSRSTLAAHGVTPANADIASPPDPANSDSEHLLASLDLAALAGRPVLIVRGESGRELMVDGLRAAGADVAVVAAYRRSVPALTPALALRLRTVLAGQHDWIITSSEALRGLMGLLERMDAGEVADGVAALAPPGALAVAKMKQQHLIVPHARIALTADGLGFTQLTLTGSGDERLLAALQSRP